MPSAWQFFLMGNCKVRYSIIYMGVMTLKCLSWLSKTSFLAYTRHQCNKKLRYFNYNIKDHRKKTHKLV